MLKSKITEVAAPKEEIQFPCLARHLITKQVYLFTERAKAVQMTVESSNTKEIGSGYIGFYNNDSIFVDCKEAWEILPKGTKIEIVVE